MSMGGADETLIPEEQNPGDDTATGKSDNAMIYDSFPSKFFE